LACAVVAVAISACVLPDYDAFLKNNAAATKSADLQEVTVTANQIVLQWDPPAQPVAKYDVYYRAHGSGSWTLLAEIPATPAPEYTVAHSTLGNGSWEFGVVAIDADGNRSQNHTSLDPTAEPVTGWFVKWQQ